MLFLQAFSTALAFTPWGKKRTFGVALPGGRCLDVKEQLIDLIILHRGQLILSTPFLVVVYAIIKAVF